MARAAPSRDPVYGVGIVPRRPPIPLPTVADGVLVVGITGAGKSTVARALAARLGVAHHELDALAIGPGWSERPSFLADVDAFTGSGGGWVADSYGGDPRARALLWSRATYVVWLDLPLAVTARRAAARSYRRSRHREPVFGGNVESWRAWLRRDHPLWASIGGFAARRRIIGELVAESGVAALRLRRPAQVRAFLAAV